MQAVTFQVRAMVLFEESYGKTQANRLVGQKDPRNKEQRKAEKSKRENGEEI